MRLTAKWVTIICQEENKMPFVIDNLLWSTQSRFAACVRARARNYIRASKSAGQSDWCARLRTIFFRLFRTHSWHWSKSNPLAKSSKSNFICKTMHSTIPILKKEKKQRSWNCFVWEGAGKMQFGTNGRMIRSSECFRHKRNPCGDSFWKSYTFSPIRHCRQWRG